MVNTIPKRKTKINFVRNYPKTWCCHNAWMTLVIRVRRQNEPI